MDNLVNGLDLKLGTNYPEYVLTSTFRCPNTYVVTQVGMELGLWYVDF
jgi:hypothetical protein